MGWEVGGAEGGWGTSFSPTISILHCLHRAI